MKTPTVLKSSRLVTFDVDQTLLIFDPDEFDPERLLPRLMIEGVPVLAHQRHINLMSHFSARGHTVVVWSKGGWAWAKKAVEILGIAQYVDLIMDKPDWYVDDMASQKWMKSPIYLHPTNPMKDQKGWIEPLVSNPLNNVENIVDEDDGK